MISFTFTVRHRNISEDKFGWEIVIQPTRNGVANGAGYITGPIHDPTLLVAEVTRLAARLALGREAS